MKIEFTTLAVLSLAYVAGNVDRYQEDWTSIFLLALAVTGVIRAVQVYKKRNTKKED